VSKNPVIAFHDAWTAGIEGVLNALPSKTDVLTNEAFYMVRGATMPLAEGLGLLVVWLSVEKKRGRKRCSAAVCARKDNEQIILRYEPLEF